MTSANAGWGLWLWWIMASTFGLLLGGAVGTEVSSALFQANVDVVALAVAFAIGGAVIGTLQWLILRRYLSRSGWWILASIVGFSFFGSLDEADPVRFAALFSFGGAIVGIAQWLVLRLHLNRSGWWVLASAVGFALFGVVPSLFEAADQAYGFIVGVALVLLTVAMYAGITGTVLIWLLRSDSSEKSGAKGPAA